MNTEKANFDIPFQSRKFAVGDKALPSKLSTLAAKNPIEEIISQKLN